MPLPSGPRRELTKTTANDIAIHDLAEDMPELTLGPFVRLANGDILGVDEKQALRSQDEGETWSATPLFAADHDLVARPERALIHTRDGVVVLAFVNDAEKSWTWDEELKDSPGAVLPTYAMRSLDGGQTWQDLQKLHDYWTGAIRDVLQTRDGRVVFTSMKMRHNPCRHTVMTYSSANDGRTWEASNVIDLGGAGHHGGATEATLVELGDGRLVKYIRTNWGRFWWAASSDGGLYWHPMGPTEVDASSAPGMLKRLASGRIALFWNRLYPEGETSYPLKGGDGVWSATPVSNHREELSVAFSEDDGATWSAPVVVARKPDGWLSYPYVFEVAPGVMWVTTMQGGLRLRLREEDFLA